MKRAIAVFLITSAAVLLFAIAQPAQGQTTNTQVTLSCNDGHSVIFEVDQTTLTSLLADVQAINAKLIGRSENILRRLSGRSEEEVREALQSAGGNVKKAMLILHGCTAEKADALLDQAGGRLRTALRNAGSSSAAASEILTVDAEASADRD